MEKDIDIVVTGYPSIDSIIKLDEEPRVGKTSIITNDNFDEKFFGGCSVNIAYLLAKLGRKVTPLFKVGHDFETSGFKHFLEEANLDLSGISVDSSLRTSATQILTDANGDHVTLFHPGAMQQVEFNRTDQQFIRRTKLGIITVGDPSFNEQFLNHCEQLNVPVVVGLKGDLNAFPSSLLRKMIFKSTILFMNEFEKDIIDSLLDSDCIPTLFNEGRVKTIVITRGSSGSSVYRKDKHNIEQINIPTAKPEKIADTTGVGDAYIAGFLHGYMSEFPIEKCGKLASVLASYIVESNGCLTNIPTESQLIERYNQNFEEDNSCLHYI